jgi:putative two-component system response regulator
MKHDIDQHGRRTAWLTARVCSTLGLARHEASNFALAALTHDIGKLDVPSALLDKPASLTDAERIIVERHCLTGAKRLMAGADDDNEDSTTAAVAVALAHHEWWNGKGYPFGLAGRSIPRCARIVAVADVFDALTSVRAYKPAWAIGAAIEHVAQGRDQQFDPECADAMLIVARALPADWQATAQEWGVQHAASLASRDTRRSA